MKYDHYLNLVKEAGVFFSGTTDHKIGTTCQTQNCLISHRQDKKISSTEVFWAHGNFWIFVNFRRSVLLLNGRYERKLGCGKDWVQRTTLIFLFVFELLTFITLIYWKIWLNDQYGTKKKLCNFHDQVFLIFFNKYGGFMFCEEMEYC